ncbi:hypothetical protein [Burkholderia glumae]|uniref:hypothetical protein n=1 Tax=Burkholderia glumae TaxID=337 RepID=UPI00192A629B|nr:hypothetical protein [Burkholderia glumae]MCQ0038387.1 hypothetical protein [Burkholderia glumae]MCR1767578.1 hypothetical protein [Burkholderia glumae]
MSPRVPIATSPVSISKRTAISTSCSLSARDAQIGVPCLPFVMTLMKKARATVNGGNRV